MTDEEIEEYRRSYDQVADGYAEKYFGELAYKPLDRALLGRLVENVGSLGPICDMGCGPGQIARYLKERGTDALGVDLSLLRQAGFSVEECLERDPYPEEHPSRRAYIFARKPDGTD